MKGPMQKLKWKPGEDGVVDKDDDASSPRHEADEPGRWSILDSSDGFQWKEAKEAE